MAYFQREIEIEVPAAVAWDALRDIGNLHTRLVQGFVVDCRLDGDIRHVRFANGVSASERIVSVSERHQRVSWSAISERMAHHNASAQVFATGPSSCRIVWQVDLLPDAMEQAIDGMVRAGLLAMRSTLMPRGAA